MQTVKAPKAPKAVNDTHQVILYMIPQLDKFPRNRRYSLGDKIEKTLLSILEALIDAAYSTKKRASLQYANRKLEVLRHLWRLSFELAVLASKSYEHGARMLNELGAQIGGWLKSANV